MFDPDVLVRFLRCSLWTWAGRWSTFWPSACRRSRSLPARGRKSCATWCAWQSWQMGRLDLIGAKALPFRIYLDFSVCFGGMECKRLVNLGFQTADGTVILSSSVGRDTHDFIFEPGMLPVGSQKSPTIPCFIILFPLQCLKTKSNWGSIHQFQSNTS